MANVILIPSYEWSTFINNTIRHTELYKEKVKLGVSIKILFDIAAKIAHNYNGEFIWHSTSCLQSILFKTREDLIIFKLKFC